LVARAVVGAEGASLSIGVNAELTAIAPGVLAGFEGKRGRAGGSKRRETPSDSLGDRHCFIRKERHTKKFL